MKKNIALVLGIAVIAIASCNKEDSDVQIITQDISNDEGNKVTLNGSITGDVDSRGFVYGTSPNPTIDNANQALASSSTASFSAIIFTDPNTTYYCKAYAYVDGQVVYGNEKTFETGYAIGQDLNGGVIAYFFASGDLGYVAGEQHGMIVATSTLGSTVPWGCTGTSIPNASGTAIGTGAANTSAIVSSCSDAGTAARLCNDLTVNGYSDWYLPSLDELKAIDANYERIDILSDGFYFTSSQSSANEAWTVYVFPPPSLVQTTENTKSNGKKVLAVRNF